MARILFLVAAVAIEVYALVHWAYKSRVATPGGVNRFIWLLVILVVPFVGPVSWLGSYLVMVAEQYQRRRYRTNPAGNSVQPPPDDDPESLNRVVDRLKRRQGRGSKDASNQSANRQNEGTQDTENRNIGNHRASSQNAGNKGADMPEPSPESNEDSASEQN